MKKDIRAKEIKSNKRTVTLTFSSVILKDDRGEQETVKSQVDLEGTVLVPDLVTGYLILEEMILSKISDEAFDYLIETRRKDMKKIEQ